MEVNSAEFTPFATTTGFSAPAGRTLTTTTVQIFHRTGSFYSVDKLRMSWFQFEFSGLLLDMYVHADILYLEHQAICDLHDYSRQCFSWVSTFSALESRHCAKLLFLA